MTEMYSHSSVSEVQGQGTSDLVSGGGLLPPSQTAGSSLYPNTARETRELSGSLYAGTDPNIRASWPRLLPRPHLQTPSHWGLGSNIWIGGKRGAEQHKHSVCSSNRYLKCLHLETSIWNFSFSLAIFPCPVFIIEIILHQISYIVLNSRFVVEYHILSISPGR